MASSTWIAHTDGGSRGNPGPAAYAFHLKSPSDEVIEECDTIGTATNNVAEYTALLRVLERAKEHGVTRLTVHSDSELLVKQMNGEYKVKNAEMQKFVSEAERLIDSIGHVTIRHVRREQNKRADELCNMALDGKPLKLMNGFMPRATATVSPTSDRGLEILRRAAVEWARGNPDDPTPESVWQRLKDVVDGHPAG